MFRLFKKRDSNNDLLKVFDGRCVKYVTRRMVGQDGVVEHKIVGKSGRIAVVDGNIRIISGEDDIFVCAVEEAKYYLLMSGDGVTVEGENSITGQYDHLTAYYSYYRK